MIRSTSGLGTHLFWRLQGCLAGYGAVLAMGLVASCLAASAFAQENTGKAVSDSESRVEISSFKGPELRSYSQMLKGLLAYQNKHELAPHSELYFILIPKNKNISLDGVTMRLASDEKSIGIPIDASGKFQLPLLELKHDDEYDLIMNRPKGQFYIKPYVKSADLADDTKRMGDMRLECQVRWAIEKQDVSVVFSTYVKLMSSGNPCEARAVAVYFFAPIGVEAVTFEKSSKKQIAQVNSEGKYTLPLEDTAILDDAIIRYVRRLIEPPKFESQTPEPR